MLAHSEMIEYLTAEADRIEADERARDEEVERAVLDLQFARDAVSDANKRVAQMRAAIRALESTGESDQRQRDLLQERIDRVIAFRNDALDTSQSPWLGKEIVSALDAALSTPRPVEGVGQQ